MIAGKGSSTDLSDGGNGGFVEIKAGDGLGANENIDSGGSLLLSGGAATFGSGGHISSTPSLSP